MVAARGCGWWPSADELQAALASAGREALAAFGDASLFVERYLPICRHLEVQIVGDGTGRVLHLFDRDCSVQRRHQKVVEEAPASVNSELARAKALDAALRIAAHVCYRSLGTVEFLAVGDEVFFLEMNTRIQVEHAVTEAVTGLDLVELQLRLAGGEKLWLTQDEVTVTRACHRGSHLRRGSRARLPAPGGAGDARALALERPRRLRPGGRPGGRDLVRPDARQARRPRDRAGKRPGLGWSTLSTTPQFSG